MITRILLSTAALSMATFASADFANDFSASIDWDYSAGTETQNGGSNAEITQGSSELSILGQYDYNAFTIAMDVTGFAKVSEFDTEDTTLSIGSTTVQALANIAGARTGLYFGTMSLDFDDSEDATSASRYGITSQYAQSNLELGMRYGKVKSENDDASTLSEFAVFTDYHITEKFNVTAQLEYLAEDDADFHSLIGGMGVEYNIYNNITASVGYEYGQTYYTPEIDTDTTRFNIGLGYTFSKNPNEVVKPIGNLF